MQETVKFSEKKLLLQLASGVAIYEALGHVPPGNSQIFRKKASTTACQWRRHL